MAIFEKKKANADELLKALIKAMDAMSDEEYDDFIGRNAKLFGELEEAAGDAKATDENDDAAEDTEKEEQSNDVEETTKEVEETDEESAEVEDEEVAETETANEPADEKAEEGSETPRNNVLKQLVARMSAVEDMLQKLTGKATEEDFGMRPSEPPQGEPVGTESDAVLRGYAGENAYKYR